MAKSTFSYRNFVFVPDTLPADLPPIRCEVPQRTIAKRVLYVVFIAVVAVGVAMFAALGTPWPLNALGVAAALLGYFLVLRTVTLTNCRWLELNGRTLRAQHLYTGRIVERYVDDVESVDTLICPHDPQSQNPSDSLGTLHGVEINFRDRGSPIRFRWDDDSQQTADELCGALFHRLAKLNELESKFEVVNGFHLLRRVYPQGSNPRGAPWSNARAMAVMGLSMVMMGGLFLAHWAGADQVRRDIGSVPPQRLTVRELIQKGPGGNPHVTLTDFVAGNYAVEVKDRNWRTVWVPLFPKNPQPGAAIEIEIVLEIKRVRNENDLEKLLAAEQVTGICAEEKTATWHGIGTRRLTEANPGVPFNLAWEIEEMDQIPTIEKIQRLRWGATVCFVLVILPGLAVVTRGVRASF